MHIPNSMLNGNICPVTAVLSLVGVAAAAAGALRAKKRPAAARFAAITAFIFAGQMMNFPILNGTSGHMMGGVLAAALLGIPFGMLSIALVVTIQCVVFSDGGFMALGANIINMSIIGAGLGGIIYKFLSGGALCGTSRNVISLAAAAWLSLMLAALACSAELALSGTISFLKVAGAMLSTHALIGIGEGLITAAAFFAFGEEKIGITNKKSAYIPLITAGITAVVLSPFASGFPDGLEWVAQKYRFLHEAAPSFVSPLSDYSVPVVNNDVLSGSLAGLIGVLITFFAAWGIARMIGKKEVCV
ncbi:MAG: energy-coupling factor ABC transporter permease [Candidatus Omnitrophota bacterium]|nr:energy-coupling factor ABC transporter permease [Candidatus Omnitrophota bacterium]